MKKNTTTLAVLVVAAVLVMGTRGSFGLFIAPWEELFSVDRASASLISAVGFLTYGFAQPVAGKLLERLSPRLVIGSGLVLISLGLVGAGLSTEMWMAVVSIGFVSAFGIGLSSLAALSYVAGELVEKRGGLIFGLLTAGGAGGQVIILPIATAALGVSLQASLFVLAALCLLGAMAVARTVPRLPARPAGIAPTKIAEMVREPRFWLLLIPFFVCGYTTTGMIETHLIPFALDHHVAQTTASAALATLAAFNVGGVLLAGALTDRLDRGKMLAAIYVMRAGTLLILPFVTSASGLFVFGALFGIADFSTVPPTTSLTQTVFRSGGWAVAIGLISASHQVGSALGAWLTGVLFERTGSYSMAFVSGSVALLVAGYLSYRLREPTRDVVRV
jgi:predicted MFS family arabinose efflux permease